MEIEKFAGRDRDEMARAAREAFDSLTPMGKAVVQEIHAQSDVVDNIDFILGSESERLGYLTMLLMMWTGGGGSLSKQELTLKLEECEEMDLRLKPERLTCDPTLIRSWGESWIDVLPVAGRCGKG